MLNYLSAYLFYPLVERCQGRRIREKFRAIRDWMAQPFAKRRLRAEQRLVHILQLAGQSVPYYRDLFRTTGFDPEKVRHDVRYLHDLPYLDKAVIREQGDRLLNEGIPRGRLHERKTGGSTGPSAFIFYSNRALDWTAAANTWALRQAGKQPHHREVHLSSRFPEQFPWRDRLKEWVKCTVLNRIDIATSAFDEPGLERLWQNLTRARPFLIQGHPSTLYALARHVAEHGYLARNVFRIFESTGELLDAKKRQAIEQTFGCRVTDRYGSAEFGVVAQESLTDPEGLMVLDAVVWPETLDQELVFTGLLNEAMPLIRYRTGDLGELAEEPNGFYLKHLFGRVHDLVHIGNRVYPTHYVQDLLDRLGGIDEFQIEARDDQPPLLRLVPRPKADRAMIASRLRDWWGDAIAVEWVGFDGLLRHGERGKFRYVA